MLPTIAAKGEDEAVGERREESSLGEFQEGRIPRQMVRGEEGEIPSL